MTVKGGTTPACAACKYQRRKCSPTCPLAPYFPANQPKMFQNVHRLFGVSNVTKTLDKLNTKDQKEDAMRSIIYEADMRERFPVHGCCAVIQQLRQRLHLAYEELHFVCANLDACRELAGNRPGSALDSCMLEFGSNETPHYGVGQFLLNDNLSGEGLNVSRPLLTLDTCADTMSSSNLSSIQSPMDAFGFGIGIHSKRGNMDFETQPFHNGTIFDERQSYNIETKSEARDAFESSPESSIEDTEEHVCPRVREMRGGGVAAENCCRSQRELRTAAAGFSLTTVN